MQASVPFVEIRCTPKDAVTLAGVDLCAGCGSAGDDARMVMCSECGECFHNYCAGPTDEAGENFP